VEAVIISSRQPGQWSNRCRVCAVLQLLECMYVRQALDLLEGLIPESEDSKDISPSHLKLLIVFAIMWSLGALLELSDRRKVTPMLKCDIYTAANWSRCCHFSRTKFLHVSFVNA